MRSKLLLALSAIILLASCKPYLSDDALLDRIERLTIGYFTDFSDPTTGMARERSNDSNPIVTTGGTGFGIMAIIAGAERGYFSREEGVARIEKIVSSLEKLERFHGAWAHWYNAETGEAFHFSEFDDGGDLVETAFLVQGLLAARHWLEADNFDLAERIHDLWLGVEWSWYTQGQPDALYWHWSKNYGFKMNHRITGYDETLITYILAASSPSYPISKELYEASYKNSSYYYNGKEYYGITLPLGMEMGGPLFFCHYSFLGLDPRGWIPAVSRTEPPTTLSAIRPTPLSSAPTQLTIPRTTKATQSTSGASLLPTILTWGIVPITPEPPMKTAR